MAKKIINKYKKQSTNSSSAAPKSDAILSSLNNRPPAGASSAVNSAAIQDHLMRNLNLSSMLPYQKNFT